MKTLLCLNLVLGTLNLFSQPAADLDKFSLQFPGKDAVYLTYSRELDIELKNDEINLSMKNEQELLLLNFNYSNYSTSSISFSKTNPLVDYSAYSEIPAGKSYKRMNPVKVETSDDLDEEIFYDDTKKSVVYYGGLGVGARTHLDYKISVGGPEFSMPFYFQTWLPCTKTQYTVRFPKEVEIDFRYFNCEKFHVTLNKTTKGLENIWTWECENVPDFKYEYDAMDSRYFLPHIYVFVKNYPVKGSTKNVLGTADDLFNLYKGYVHGLNEKPSPLLQHIADSLTAGKINDYEKIKAIYYWVEEHIKYVAFESGMGGFIPRQADSICQKRYGDCKDMASIITALLHHAGIPAYLGWIGTRTLPYLYSDAPFPIIDNHMIAVVPWKDEFLFLDGTGNRLQLGYPSDFIQEKEVFTMIDSLHYKIIPVPVMPPSASLMSDSIHCRLDGTRLVGTGIYMATGYLAEFVSGSMLVRDADEQKKFIESYLEIGSNKFRLDSFRVISMINRDSTLIIKYDFSVADYAIKSGNDLYVNLFFEKPYKNDVIDTSSEKLDKSYRYESSRYIHYSFDVPAGYAVKKLPSGFESSYAYFPYSVRIFQTPKQLDLIFKAQRNYLRLPASEFPAYNKNLSVLTKKYSETIELNPVSK